MIKCTVYNEVQSGQMLGVNNLRKRSNCDFSYILVTFYKLNYILLYSVKQDDCTNHTHKLVVFIL